MKVTPTMYAEALYEAVKTASLKEIEGIARRLLLLLRQRRHWRMLPQIERQFNEVIEQKEGLLSVKFVTAHAHVSAQQLEWVRYVVRRLLPDAQKRRVELERSVDASLIGGFVARVKDKVVDGSVQSFVRQLREKLKIAPIN